MDIRIFLVLLAILSAMLIWVVIVRFKKKGTTDILLFGIAVIGFGIGVSFCITDLFYTRYAPLISFLLVYSGLIISLVGILRKENGD